MICYSSLGRAFLLFRVSFICVTIRVILRAAPNVAVQLGIIIYEIKRLVAHQVKECWYLFLRQIGLLFPF